MKFVTILGAVFALAQANFISTSSSISSVSSTGNLLKNGDFRQNDLGGNSWVITKRLPGWETSEI